MTEKICFMQFYEIDITWQMTSTFDFSFFLCHLLLSTFPTTICMYERCMQNKGKEKLSWHFVIVVVVVAAAIFWKMRKKLGTDIISIWVIMKGERGMTIKGRWRTSSLILSLLLSFDIKWNGLIWWRQKETFCSFTCQVSMV